MQVEVEVETRASRGTINIRHSSRGELYARGDATRVCDAVADNGERSAAHSIQQSS